jgi:hypothetical protein
MQNLNVEGGLLGTGQGPRRRERELSTSPFPKPSKDGNPTMGHRPPTLTDRNTQAWHHYDFIDPLSVGPSGH